MPGAIPRQCRVPGCPRTTTEANGFCTEHQSRATGWTNPRRGSSSERGYGWRWRKLRAQILERDKGLCQPCMRDGRVMPAVAVDHIVPKAEGGTDEPENLEAICKRCHQLKTADEARRGKRRGQGQKFRA